MKILSNLTGFFMSKKKTKKSDKGKAIPANTLRKLRNRKEAKQQAKNPVEKEPTKAILPANTAKRMKVEGFPHVPKEEDKTVKENVFSKQGLTDNL